jgi:hypothetical protein
VSGLSHQQVANDPGGDRWVLLSRRAVEMYLADLDRRTTTETKAKAATKTKATRPRKATR